MPLIHVHMAEGRTQEQKRAMMEALTRAVHEALDASVESIRVWITEFSATDYMVGGELLADRTERRGEVSP